MCGLKVIMLVAYNKQGGNLDFKISKSHLIMFLNALD